MMFSRLGLINRKQLGFTLLELLVALAISGLVTGATTMTIFQVLDGNARTSNHMTAVRQVQNAGYWVSHDALMAQQEPVIVNNGAQFESLTLTWTEWDSSNVHQVVYSLLANNEFQRSHSINGTTETAIIAQFINPDPAMTSCDFTGGKLTFTVTATVGGGSQEQSETRIYEIVPRPGS